MSIPPFQVFCDSHRDDVYRFCLVAVGPQDADDCFQETFLAALRAYPKLRDASNLRAWILAIASRKAIDSHRARRRRAVPVDPLPDRADLPPPEPEPLLWTRIRTLPPKQRASVLYRFVNDLPYADIGRIVGCSEEAARQNVREGLRRLKGAWAK